MQHDKEELLRAMYEEYQGTLRRVVRMAGIPDADVEDVVQETFIAFFSHYPLTWTPLQKKSMLMRIVKNKCVDFFRKNKHYNYVSIDTEDFDETEILTEYVMKDSLEHVLLDETCEEVRGEIEAMKKAWKDVAVLSLVEERSVPEICEILELESSVCRMRLSRIRKYLRSRYGPPEN